MQEHKIRLLEAKVEAEKEVAMYKGLLEKAQASLNRIQAELNADFTPGNSRYSHGELAAVRRGIRAHMPAGQWISPRELCDRLYEMDADLIMREIHKMAKDHRSDVLWNQRQGPASKYTRG